MSRADVRTDVADDGDVRRRDPEPLRGSQDHARSGLAAGARSVLVPTEVTLPEEVAAAPVVRPDLLAAVHHLLGKDLPRDRNVSENGTDLAEAR